MAVARICHRVSSVFSSAGPGKYQIVIVAVATTTTPAARGKYVSVFKRKKLKNTVTASHRKCVLGIEANIRAPMGINTIHAANAKIKYKPDFAVESRFSRDKMNAQFTPTAP